MFFPPRFHFLGSLDSRSVVELLQSGGITVHLLELVQTDSRPDLVELRNRGVENFIVDVGADLVEIFFGQVIIYSVSLTLATAFNSLILFFLIFFQAMKSGIVHTKSTFILSDLVSEKRNAYVRPSVWHPNPCLLLHFNM